MLCPLVAAVLASTLIASPAQAANYSFNFDGVSPGTEANAAIGAAFPIVRFDYGIFDSNQKRWLADPSWLTPAVTVDNPLLSFHGAAPSGANALNALWQPVLMQFATPLQLASFSMTQDNSVNGSVSQLLFLDTAGAILKNISFDQTRPGLTISSGLISGYVSSILLPSNSFYDNINVDPVPEASNGMMLLTGLLFMGYVLRRRSA